MSIEQAILGVVCMHQCANQMFSVHNYPSRGNARTLKAHGAAGLVQPRKHPRAQRSGGCEAQPPQTDIGKVTAWFQLRPAVPLLHSSNS